MYANKWVDALCMLFLGAFLALVAYGGVVAFHEGRLYLGAGLLVPIVLLCVYLVFAYRHGN